MLRARGRARPWPACRRTKPSARSSRSRRLSSAARGRSACCRWCSTPRTSSASAWRRPWRLWQLMAKPMDRRRRTRHSLAPSSGRSSREPRHMQLGPVVPRSLAAARCSHTTSSRPRSGRRSGSGRRSCSWVALRRLAGRALSLWRGMSVTCEHTWMPSRGSAGSTSWSAASRCSMAGQASRWTTCGPYHCAWRSSALMACPSLPLVAGSMDWRTSFSCA
mmetsp:Transcript_24608/g.77343  ORF Transcript_24608/g.77343 Transcript_24608/m.77343 type:complete len:220 (-) Transcript_24608:173-832(-)